MARPTTIKGSKFLIELGDGASPETFDAPCALTTKGINFSAATNEFNVPDCNEPDAAVWTERVVSALSAGVTGSGTLAMESLAVWRDWFLSALEKNIRVRVVDDAGVQPGYFALSSVLTSFNIGANQGELATIEVEMSSNGEVTWTDET